MVRHSQSERLQDGKRTMDGKPTSMDPLIRADVLRRLQCIEGHTRGVYRMVEGDADCASVIRQIRALQGGLGKVRLLLLEDYLHAEITPVLRASAPDERENILGQLVELLSVEGLK